MKTNKQYMKLNTVKLFLRQVAVVYVFFILFTGLLPLFTFGQDVQGSRLDQLFLSGSKGTVIHLIFNDAYIKELKFDPTDRVMIYKSYGKRRKREFIKEVVFPNSAKELSTRLGIENTKALMNNLEVASEEELYEKIITQPADSLGLNLFSFELQEALGLVYIDDNWKQGDVVNYEIEKLNAKNEILQRMSHSVNGESYTYPYKFKLSEEVISDSLAQFTWSTPVNVEYKGAFPVFSKLMQKSDLDAEYQMVGMGIVSPSMDSDSSHVFYRQELIPGQVYSFYSVLYDWAGNESIPSDTVYTMSVSADEIDLITEFRAEDALEHINLSWAKLKNSAIYTGIEISKSRFPDSGYVVLDTVNSQETMFNDKKVIRGSAYYYRIRPLLLIDNPTRAFDYAETSAVFSYRADHPAPSRPEGLLTSTHQEGIKISWWPPNEIDIFGYYVLRGIDPNNMERIGDIVRDTVYIDKNFPSNFSGDLYYALLAMNQNQQLSDTSDVIAFGIRQQLALTPPAGLAVYDGEHGLSMRWNDVKAVDDRVTNYLLLRRKKGEEKYGLLKVEEKVEVPFFVYAVHPDEKGIAFEYAVASQDVWGNYSSPSSPVMVISSRGIKVDPPSEVLLRNLKSGIEVSWPNAYEIDEEVYIIYRKEEGEDVFKELTRVDPRQVDYFIDKAVTTDRMFEYCISIINKNIEGDKSSSSSIIR